MKTETDMFYARLASAIRSEEAQKPKKPLAFITVRDIQTGRTSSIGIHGNRDKGALSIIGGLEHNSQVVPDSMADADTLIAWLEEWKRNKVA